MAEKGNVCWVQNVLMSPENRRRAELWCETSKKKRDIYQMSSSMLHLSNGYELTLSLYNRVQNDCQISWFFFFFFLVLKCCQFWSFFHWDSLCHVFTLVWLVFWFLLIALVTALPQKNLYLPYWFALRNTQPHTVGPFLWIFFFPTLWCKIKCVYVKMMLISLVSDTCFLHSQPHLGLWFRPVDTGSVGSNALDLIHVTMHFKPCCFFLRIRQHWETFWHQRRNLW